MLPKGKQSTVQKHNLNCDFNPLNIAQAFCHIELFPLNWPVQLHTWVQGSATVQILVRVAKY